MLLLFILVLFVVLVGGGWLLGRGIGEVLFGSDNDNNTKYVDKSVHHHYTTNNNNTIINNENKTISVIDDETKKSVLIYKKELKVKKTDN